MDDMKPIIEMIQGQLESQIEGEVYRAVQHVGINVDKEWLLQALKAARAFWQEGYEVGRRGKPEWISVNERLPMIRTRVLVAYKDGVTVAEYRGYDVCKGKQQMYWCGIKGTKHVLRSITHWMPLPSTEGLE